MSVVLYSSHCPKCSVLEKKLNEKLIEFELFDDVDAMIEKGFDDMPKLEVDGVVISFKEANEWVGRQ